MAVRVLPWIFEQKKILDWIEDVAKRVGKANYDAESAFKRLGTLRMSAFYDLSEGAARRAMEDVTLLVRRQAVIDPAADYPNSPSVASGKELFKSRP